MKKSIFLFFAAILCAVGMNAYGATQRYIYVGLSNNYHQWKNESQWGINHWGGTGAGVMPGSKITDLQTTITHSGCTFHMYRMYVYDDNKNFEFKGNDGWWDCKKENISISGTTGNALLFRDNDGGDGGNPTFYQTDYKETSTVSLSASAASVSVGEEVTLTPTLTSNAEFNEIKSITYSVGTGATVSTDGKFVATAAGTYTVTATITYNPKHFTGITTEVNNLTCEIVVSEVVVPHPVTDVTVNPTSVTIKQGATATLTATVAPSNADDPSVTWSSDNQSVATVDNGIVTAVAPGTANITVTTVDGGFTATCAVKVKPLQYTFYAINSAQWPTVAAHYWEGADGGSAWPGADMVKESETINGFDIYSITISSDFINIMFTNQIDGDKNKKTADLTTEGNDGKYYDIKDAKWYASLSEIPVSYEYYVIGTINNWGLKDENFGMTDEDADGVYEKVITLADGKNQLKINKGEWKDGEIWGYDQLAAQYEGVSRGKDGDDNNIIIDITPGKDITIKFDKNTSKITLEGLTEKAPAPTYDYYLTGSLVGGWDVKQQGIEKVGELYKHTCFELGAGIYEFKITAGDWEHQWNYNNLGAAYEEVSQGVDGEGKPNGNIKIVTEEAKNITVIFDATAGKITLEGLTPYVAPLTYTVTVPAGTEKCYIAGAFAQSNWNTFLEMEQVTGEDKFTITITGAKESDEYKYACQADWAYAEVIEGGGNRTAWSALDEVTAWNKPVIVTYQLKGVGGWDQPGIELVQNPGNDKEYMLTCQAISATDAIKVVRLEDGVIKDYYGNGTVKDGVEVTVNYDDDGNITLDEGTYNFYFDTNEAEKKLWIAAATDCVTEPEYNVVEDVITNFVFDTEAWPMVCMGGPSTTYQVEVFLTLTEDADGTLAYEDCSVSIMGTDATFIDGTLSNIDVFAPYADAVLHVQWDGDYYELQLAMSSTPAEPITIEAEDATVTLTEYPTNFEATEFAYELGMVANWDNEAESLSYTVEFVIPTFDPTAASGEYNANFFVTGDGDAAGMNENVSVTVTKDGNNVTLTGNVSALNGNAYDVTISGTLPVEETPDYNVVEDEITNFVFDTEAWPMVCTGGPSTTYQVEVFLTLTEDADGTLAYEDCSVSIMGTDATFIDGTLSNIDVFAPYADAVLHVQWNGEYYELQLAMSSTPAEAMTIEAEDATVTLTEYPTNFEATEFANELKMVANWVNEVESLPYTVEFVIPTFDPTKASGEYIANFYVTGEGDAAGMNENVSVTVTKDGNNVTLTGNVSALNGNAYNVTISGTLPVAAPDYTRTTTLGKFGTICLPFGSTNYTGMELFECVGQETGKVYIASVTTLEAGVPYIFLATGTELAVYSDGTTADEAGNNNGLHGTFDDNTVVEAGNYILYNNAFIPADGTTNKVNANRAYLDLADIEGGVPTQMPGRRYIGMSVQGENEATGLDNIATSENAVKVISNGQLIIIRGGEKYNVQGQKL